MHTPHTSEPPPSPELGLCVRYTSAGGEYEMLITSIRTRPTPEGRDALRQEWFNVIGIGIVTAVFLHDALQIGDIKARRNLWEGSFKTDERA